MTDFFSILNSQSPDSELGIKERSVYKVKRLYMVGADATLMYAFIKKYIGGSTSEPPLSCHLKLIVPQSIRPGFSF
jgi:hypothetical protein